MDRRQTEARQAIPRLRLLGIGFREGEILARGHNIFLHLTGVPLRSTPAGEKVVSDKGEIKCPFG